MEDLAVSTSSYSFKRKKGYLKPCVACSAGVLLLRANGISSRSFIRPAMFDLLLDWTVGVGGGGGAKRRLPEEAVKML